MLYKDVITTCCRDYWAAYHPLTRFIGYNTVRGSRMYGTLAAIPADCCIETPVSENLMMGLAMGMCLEGYHPVVCFERHDFILLALDAIVNHVDKLPSMGDIRLPILIRAIVGGTYPLNAGPQHTQDHTAALRHMCKNIDVITPETEDEFRMAWSIPRDEGKPVIIVEYKDKYEQAIAQH